MKYKLILLLSAASLFACNPDSSTGIDPTLAAQNANQIFTELLSPKNLFSEHFEMDNSIDNILEGQYGTKIRINKNTFVDASGSPVTGSVEIELKEAIFPSQRVMANLQTMFNGQALETGGMIYLNATSEGAQLSIADSKEIKVMMPSDTLLGDMSLFEGNSDSSIIEWANPIPLAAKPDTGIVANGPVPEDMVFERAHNIRYNVLEFPNMDDIPDSVSAEVGRIAWAGTGLKITKDSSFEIHGFTVNFFKQEELTWHRDVFSFQRGQNSYITDQKTNYIFSMSKLGWANIDRLLQDPRTEEVEMLLAASNHADFDYVYVTLLTEKMYLPGYQKKDYTYSFTHGDYELPQLPIGAKAVIMATAYKDDVVFFDFKTITIQKQQEITLELAESGLGEIEAIVSSEI